MILAATAAAIQIMKAAVEKLHVNGVAFAMRALPHCSGRVNQER
jgi:hypothetical protein